MDANQSNLNSGEFLEDDDNKSIESEVKVYYNKNNYISGPVQVTNGTISIDTLQFHHSYGYDCRRNFNLCVPDPNTLIFSSGAFLHFFNLNNNKLTFQRCSTGIGIGHIAKNATESHIAVGETGEDPPIIIYEWPNMEIVTILHKGTKKNYSHLAYSPDGKFLLSQGCSPDYSLTIWNWFKSIPLLRCKSHEQEINNAIFSPTIAGDIVTSGSGHIKFWKISKTFTGLKLEGCLGKFGRTEISDIIGLYSMPDEKVISGCEWGNILVWEEGLIKLEVRRKNNKPCHTKMITQFEYCNGDLMSMGMDGWIRVWSYETIDQTDVSEDKGIIEIEPINEFEVCHDDEHIFTSSLHHSMIMSLEKKYPDDNEDKQWYGQDGNGGLWLIDLSTFDEAITSEDSEKKCRKLLTCHAGAVMDMTTCTWDNYLATIGSDGNLHVYNYVRKKLIINHGFSEGGSAAVWLPCSLDKTGSSIVCGFQSGVVRVVRIVVAANLASDAAEDDDNLGYVRLIQAAKPHTDEVTKILLNTSAKLLITGSKDSTIFLFSIIEICDNISLMPIGFIKVPSAVTCITWKFDDSSTVLIGCSDGHFGEVELRKYPLHDEHRKTYQLENPKSTFRKFRSIKSAIKREIMRQELEKERNEKREIMRKKMEEYKALNPGIEIDEETFLEDIEEPPPLPDIYIPKEANQVQSINYSNVGTIWLSMGGYDAGYIYEYPSISVGEHEDHIVKDAEVLRATLIHDGDDLELQSCLIYSDKFIFLGLEHGELRICRINRDNFTDLSDYLSYPIHDYYHGDIKKILLSYDEGFLFTCGSDGNVFSFIINFGDENSSAKILYEKNDKLEEIPETDVEDIKDVNHPSLEQVIIATETERIMSLTKKNRDDMYHLLRNLTRDYQAIMDRNKGLIKSQQIPPSDFVLDKRIADDLNHQLKVEMDLIGERMAFKIEKNKLILRKLMEHFVMPITCLPFAVSRILKPDTMIHSVNEKNLGEDFQAEYAHVLQKILEADDEEKNFEAHPSKMVNKIVNQDGDVIKEEIKSESDNITSFLQDHNISTDSDKLTVEMRQMLRKYSMKKCQIEKRAKEWEIMYASKPDLNSDHPEDIERIEKAKRTIGDYKLKMSEDYNVSEKERETTLTKYKQLLDCRKKCHYLREAFNDKLKSIRSKKLSLQNEVYSSAEKKLNSIHAEIPKNYVKELREIREIDASLEYPENNLEPVKYISMAEKVKEARRQKQSIIDETMHQALDEEFRTILPDESLFEHYSDLLPTSLTPKEKKRIKQVEIPDNVKKILKDNDDRTITPWEREMKTIRLSRKLYEQDCIIHQIEKSYEDIDGELDELEGNRLQVYADGVYFELYKLTLHQELVVLRDSEKMENVLREKVTNKSQEKTIALNTLQSILKNIDKKNRDIKNIQTKMKEQSVYFMNAIQDNKYTKFLIKIYKKRVKTHMTQDSSSDSSDDSTDDDDDDDDSDGSSINLHKIALTTLDENICPADCSRDLYDLAFSMRLKRHEDENEIREEQKNVEFLMRKVDHDSKKIKIIEKTLTDCKQTLHDFMYDKQCKLNDIDMTLLLKFHQLQHFNEDDHITRMNNCVVFDITRLSQLYTRVGELQNEAFNQKIMHKKNCTHLHRMNIDCKYMDNQIKLLKNCIREEMIKKFGCTISLVSLYEAVVRRLIYNIKANMTDNSRYDKQFKCLRKRYDEYVVVLENLIRDNTEKLSLVTILTEELIKFRGIARKYQKNGKSRKKGAFDWQKDVENLEEILENQKEQKMIFHNDVRNLKLKIRSLPPISSRRKLAPSLNKIVEKNEEQAIVKDNFTLQDKKLVVEILRDEHDSAFRIVRNLLLKIIKQYVEIEEAESIVDEFFHEIFKKQSNIPTKFLDNFMEICEKIEKKIEEISGIFRISDKIREIIQEYANEIISQMEIEARGIGVGSIEISWNVKPKLDDFLDSMEIKKDVITEVYVMKFLKMENGLELATDYILTKLPMKPDAETIVALREHASRTLRDIQREIQGESENETTVQSSNSGL